MSHADNSQVTLPRIFTHMRNMARPYPKNRAHLYDLFLLVYWGSGGKKPPRQRHSGGASLFRPA